VLGSTSRPGISILLRVRVIPRDVPRVVVDKRVAVCRSTPPGTGGAIDEPYAAAVPRER
jgi:hypothetical protein